MTTVHLLRKQNANSTSQIRQGRRAKKLSQSSSAPREWQLISAAAVYHASREGSDKLN